MANVQYTENLTEDQLDAMAGSETLRYHATSFGMTRNNKVCFFRSSKIQNNFILNLKRVQALVFSISAVYACYC